MSKCRYYQVDAFTTERFSGNAAGVVLDADGLSEAQMQAIAREANNSETAFVLAPDAEDHDVRIRFFTPMTEVPSCGHATIATHYVRAVTGGLPATTTRHKIGIGVLPIDIEPVGDDYRIVMTQGRPEFEAPLGDDVRQRIVDAIGLGPEDIDERCPVQVVSTGHSKVMLALRSIDRLHALAPDLGRLKAISAEIGCNGYYTFVLTHDEYLVHGRMFAPAIGIAEDPATGNANGPLGAYLIHHDLVDVSDNRLVFDARQGEAMGRPGTVQVEVAVENGKPATVRVAGRAVIVYEAQMEV